MLESSTTRHYKPLLTIAVPSNFQPGITRITDKVGESDRQGRGAKRRRPPLPPGLPSREYTSQAELAPHYPRKGNQPLPEVIRRFNRQGRRNSLLGRESDELAPPDAKIAAENERIFFPRKSKKIRREKIAGKSSKKSKTEIVRKIHFS